MTLAEIPVKDHRYPFLNRCCFEKLNDKVAILSRCRMQNKIYEVLVDNVRFENYLNNPNRINELMEDISKAEMFFLLTRINPQVGFQNEKLIIYFSALIKGLRNSYPELQEQSWLKRMDPFPELEWISL